MYVLPKIPSKFVKQMNKLIESFIWNGRKPKIQLSKLQALKKDGGLGLVNLEMKDAALKASWIQYLENDDFMKESAHMSINKNLADTIWLCNLKTRSMIT